MKVAFLFAGQLREISREFFKESLSILIKDLDYDIYVYHWQEKGKSLNHSKLQHEISLEKNAEIILNDLFEGFNVKKIDSESFRDFERNLDKKHQEIINSKKFHFGTINSFAQIYTISRCFQMLKQSNINYDVIFRCRFDSLFLHPIREYNLEEFKKNNMLYSINFGRSYYPNRIYDIFFGGSFKSMCFLDDIWEKLPSLVFDVFDNNLDKRDSCRLLYLAAAKNGIKVGSFESRICDVFRNFKNNYYEKYLISMHLISLRYLIKNLKVLPYFFNWFRFRKFKKIYLFLDFSKAFLMLPISYLKRLKYLLSI